VPLQERTSGDKACKTCHGPTGEADPGIVKMMKVEIEHLGSHDVQSLGDDDLKKIVTGKSVDDVIAYIRTLKKRNRTRNIGLRTRRSANAQNAPEAFSEEEKYAA
jgi:mono/diheme cytochrome c family protein